LPARSTSMRRLHRARLTRGLVNQIADQHRGTPDRPARISLRATFASSSRIGVTNVMIGSGDGALPSETAPGH
jgi:hypothetical protein